ncbi:hypothetical protein MKX01_000295 [Papaver californicum]|nr:hypothetical protein MKX01_000295 [Papaver californicum]
MAAKGEPVSYYSPLPPNPNYQQQQQQDQYYIVLPLRNPNRSRYCKTLRKNILCFFSVLLLALTFYCLYPSDPVLKVERVNLSHLKIHTNPMISLDIVMDLTIKVYNRDVYSLDYDSLIVSIGYHGKKLGFVSSNEGHLKPRTSSYVKAQLRLDGIEILHDVFYLLEDLAKGSIPFDTVTEIQGKLGLFFFQVPIKGKMSCEVYVSTSNQTVVRQNCYPE